MNDDALDASIPLLTEIIEPEPGFAAAPKHAAPAAAAADVNAIGGPAAALASMNAPQWEALEQRISARILQQLQTRIDVMLEQRLRAALADALQRAVEGMATEVRSSLHHGLEDVIAGAVAQEIARLQTGQNLTEPAPSATN